MKDENVAGVTCQDWLHYCISITYINYCNAKLQSDHRFIAWFTETVRENMTENK